MNDYSEFRQNVALKTTDDDLFENGPYNKCEKLGLLLRWCYLVGKLHGVRVCIFMTLYLCIWHPLCADNVVPHFEY